MTRVSIIIPAKDEAETLPTLLKELRGVTETLSSSYAFEIIVVDDHCRDRTGEIARAGGAVVVENKRRPGKGNALITGFEKASGEIFIMMDADGSHRPEDIPHFLTELGRGHGLVVGSR